MSAYRLALVVRALRAWGSGASLYLWQISGWSDCCWTGSFSYPADGTTVEGSFLLQRSLLPFPMPLLVYGLDLVPPSLSPLSGKTVKPLEGLRRSVSIPNLFLPSIQSILRMSMHKM